MKEIFSKFFGCIGNAILAVLIFTAALLGAISGLINKACGKKWQSFARQVDEIGVFNAQGTNEKDCKCWTHTFDFGPFKNVKVALSSKIMNNSAELAVVSKQFKTAVASADKVLAAVKDNWLYKKMLEDEGIDSLVPNNDVYAELSIAGDNHNPYMAIFYTTGKYQAWISVEDGEMTAFDLS